MGDRVEKRTSGRNKRSWGESHIRHGCARTIGRGTMTGTPLTAKDGSSNESIFIGKSKGRRGLRLPPADTQRWSSRRKAAVVIGIRAGAVTREEAVERYKL